MMKRRSLFGSHLYNQIVYPLLAASVLVGLLAALVAMYFMNQLTQRWVEDVARSTTVALSTRTTEVATQMLREAGLVADDVVHLVRELPDGSGEQMLEATLQTAIDAHNNRVEFEKMVVLDENGVVVASAGAPRLPVGSSPLGPINTVEPSTRFAKIDGDFYLTAMEPLSGDARGYSLAVARRINESFLRSLGINRGNVVCLYDQKGQPIECVAGSDVPTTQAQLLHESMSDPANALSSAVQAAIEDEGASGVAKVDGVMYRVWAQRVTLPDMKGAGSQAYLVDSVSQDVSSQAARTTRNLITMWSIVAVVAMVGLGGWVARRVSDPLVELAAGARRVTDGDFTTRVEVGGVNEISELADSFNNMTESLRERSDSLTKKVLELATLYEMSRSLGSTLDMDELLQSVLDSGLRIFDLDLGYVTLRERESGELQVRVLRDGRDELPDAAMRSSMSEWVVREGRPLIFNPDASSNGGQIDSITGAKAALCVPLVSSEGTIGAITIGSSDPAYRFNSDDVRLLSTIANHVTMAVGNIELFSSLQEAYLATVRSLATAVDAKDSYTRGHSDRVAQYATLIAEEMGLSHEQRIALEMAAYLHDIGKIGVAEDILHKPGKLSDAEMIEMRHHPLIGANILKPVAFPWAITPVVRHHHEAWDGSGYPAGLRGEEIPLLARILTVADSYEAMTADRPYRQGMDLDVALDELRACAGQQFDPRVVDVFATILTQLEESGAPLPGESADEVNPEEARAIFAALLHGVLVSFRRLGGPRLASNVEHEIDEFFRDQDMTFRIENGSVSFIGEAPFQDDSEITQMRAALRRLDAIMGRVSGDTLVEHFYDDAMETLSARMRRLARQLEFVEQP